MFTIIFSSSPTAENRSVRNAASWNRGLPELCGYRDRVNQLLGVPHACAVPSHTESGMALCGQYNTAEVTPEQCQERLCSFHHGLWDHSLWRSQPPCCEDMPRAPREATWGGAGPTASTSLQVTCMSHFGNKSSSPRKAFRKL